VSSRFIEIKKSLQDALQTDIANNGTSHAESLDGETNGLASRCAHWIYAASLSELHPKGLTDAELAEYLVAPGQSIAGLQEALKKLYDTCWYIEQTKSGRYFFHLQKNLNAQINSYAKMCTPIDRDAQIEAKLTEMFEPRDKRCYQKVAVLPALDKVQLERDRITLVICKPDIDVQKFFGSEKYKNRVTFLTAIDQTGIFDVNKKAERLWTILQVVQNLTVANPPYKKAHELLPVYQTELFMALKGVFNKLSYPLIDAEGETALVSTSLLDGYVDERTGHTSSTVTWRRRRGNSWWKLPCVMPTNFRASCLVPTTTRRKSTSRCAIKWKPSNFRPRVARRGNKSKTVLLPEAT